MPNDYLSSLTISIEKAVSAFDTSLPSIQREMLSEIEALLSELDFRDGSLVASAKNLRIISRVRGRLESIIVENPLYAKNVRNYLSAYGEITRIQQNYFDSVSEAFKASDFLKELQAGAEQGAISSLLRAGISANLVDPLQNILRQNITTGTSYSDLVGQLREYIQGNREKVGELEKYVKTIVTDGLNQYAAQYTDAVTSDLGLNWFQYTGVRMVTSRPFCLAMVQKRFFHRSEIPKLLRGEFPEFYEARGRLSRTTGLPEGMVAGENSANFLVYRGGWNCHHQCIPVTEDIIPKGQRVRVYVEYGIPHDGKGFATSA
jgi:hypothetical protein